MIPKRIIHIWCGTAEMPLLLKSAIINVKLLHPDFEYLFFGDREVNEFVRELYPQYESVFESFRFPIQRYDFFRYLAVHHYGGFYLDLDVFLARDLTPLLERNCVFPFEEVTRIPFFWSEYRMDWQIGNWAFGAEPGHPYITAIIENCVRGCKDESWVMPMMAGIPKLLLGSRWDQYYVTNSTGPGLISRTLAETPALWGDIDVLFPEDVGDPRGWYHFGEFGVHANAGTWRGPEGAISRRIARLWESWSLRRALAEARRRGKTRSLIAACGAQTQAN